MGFGLGSFRPLAHPLKEKPPPGFFWRKIFLGSKCSGGQAGEKQCDEINDWGTRLPTLRLIGLNITGGSMSHYRRAYIFGGTYFFTVVTYRRQHLFHQEIARSLLRQAILQTRQNYPFTIQAWVLLPDHLHCLWTLPPGDDDFSIRWNFIQSRFSKIYSIGFLFDGLGK